MVFRGMRSEIDPERRRVADSAPVVRDTARLLAAADTRNAAASSGSSGCMQYIIANVEKPAANRATVVRRKAEVERSMGGEVVK
jgi:hypothetical protein